MTGGGGGAPAGGRRSGRPAPASSNDDSGWQSAHTLYLVKQLEMIVRAQMEPIVRSCDLTVPRYTAMTILESTPDISSAELARRTFVSAQAANELVSGLHERGLVERRPNPDHGKIMLLRLTDSGRDTLARCVPKVRELEQRMLIELSAGSAAEFRQNLRASIRALQPEVN